MYCPNCGKTTDVSSEYCLYCGCVFENNISNENKIYQQSYYKKSYKKSRKRKPYEYSFAKCFLKGAAAMFLLCVCIFGALLAKNYYLTDMVSLDKIKYLRYKEDPSLIPELIQPETLDGLVNNLKNVQNFLVLYLKISDDSQETKLEIFDRYRTELLKLQNFDNTNLLQENVQHQIPRSEKEFKIIKEQYDKILSAVGLTIVVDETYAKYRLEEDNRFTYKVFGRYLPPDVSLYLKIRAKNYQPCVFKDRLTIKPFKLAQRIGEYENFMNLNKDFRYINEVRDLLFSYSFIYSFTSDRTDKIYIDNKTFVKSDRKFIQKFPNSHLETLFLHLASSANGISESQFDKMYPYEYQKTLNALKPEKSELADIFTLIRKNIAQLKNNASYEYTYISSSGSWELYNASKPLKKGDIILAQTDNGYDIYDYKYKKTNRIIKPQNNVKLFIKSGQLYAYSPNYLQISSLDNMCGGFNLRALTPKAIKKIFPNTLIINLDTFDSTSVRIDKQPGPKTYMLISMSGINYAGYKLSGNIKLGELSNIFTIASDEDTQIDWSSDTESYHMYFITHSRTDSEKINDFQDE